MINKTTIGEYRLNGVLKISNIIDTKTISTLKKEYKKYINKLLKQNKDRKKKDLGKNFNFIKNPNIPTSIHRLESHKSSYFFKVATRKIFNEIGSKLMKSKNKIHSIQFFFKNKKENLPTPLHQDNAYWCRKNGEGLSFWVALNATNKKNGCMYYYKKTHKKKYVHKASDIPGSSLVIRETPKKEKIFFKLNPGDCVIHSSKTVHGSFKNTSTNNRLAFIICFITKNSQQDKKLKKNYELNLKKRNLSRSKLIN